MVRLDWQTKIKKLEESGIAFDSRLLSPQIVRGIYGIFKKASDSDKDYCVYIGRAINIRERCLNHFRWLIFEKEANNEVHKDLKRTLKERGTLMVKVLEEVKYKKDNYNRDLQRLAHAESCWIEYYQEKGEALLQKPEGNWISEDCWNRLN